MESVYCTISFPDYEYIDDNKVNVSAKTFRTRSNDRVVVARESKIVQSDKQKCTPNPNKYINILPKDSFGNGVDEGGTTIDLKMEISREYQQLDRSTMEPMRESGAGPARLVNSRYTIETYVDTGRAEERRMSREYQQLDRSTMESRNERSDAVHTDHFGKSRHQSEAYFDMKSSEKRRSWEYQNLDRRTMEAGDKNSDIVPTNRLGNSRDASGAYLDRVSLAQKRASAKYQD